MAEQPVATYRVQLNKNFGLEQARALLPFLHKMGISHLYASPIFVARPGSMHGYDVTDPSRVNPEIGGEEAFEALVSELKTRGMGLVLDIVPNHMAASSDNAWWMDLLENGASSMYGTFFDVEWGPTADAIADKIFLPILGSPYGASLENGEFQLRLDAEGFFVSYYSTRLPLDPSTYAQILDYRSDRRPESDEFSALLDMIHRLPEKSSMAWEAIEARRRDVPLIKKRLWRLYDSDPRARAFIDENIEAFNGRKGDPRSFDALDDLLDRQAYRIAWWQVARERINYRRFFDVSDLVGVRQENERAFAATHETALRWVQDGKVQGLRIDHIDGLHNPRIYLERLAANEPRPYVVVEKILLGDECLRDEWPIDGTTGYDFLDMLNGVLVDESNMPALSEIYSRFTGLNWNFAEAAYDQKRWILRQLFRGEFSALALHLALIAEADRHGRDISPWELRRAMIEITASLPVYRTYVEGERVSARDREYIEQAVRNARERNPHVSDRAYEFARHVLLLEFPPTLGPEGRREWVLFVMRWQQLTGPITAKGVEDTAMYLYNRLISLNEVGSEAEATPLARFHQFNAERGRAWPATMNATSTHDTKRSEDVRARINVLSEMPDQWGRWVRRWSRWNRDKKALVDGRLAPDANEEMLLYQTLLGAWPLRPDEESSFRERLKQYLVKAMREAKVYSTWLKPDEERENAVLNFTDAILEPGTRFREHFLTVLGRIAMFGALNSLSQTLVKITAPGIPDFYQNTLFWDFSLVDPDNRRPVNVEERLRVAQEMDAWTRPNCAAELLETWTDGRVKAFVAWHALRMRNANPDLFAGGDYIPVAAEGERARHVLAFARRRDGAWCVTAIPRFASEFSGNRYPLGQRAWGDTRLVPPEGFGPWRNALTGEAGESWKLSDLLATFPVALLAGGG
ncbi:MAG TPA: malto-oligosyltrehalose synthase [Bryobacteraceae bacterium]|nr:malto-oligosyltrehalose synthase [Bryobacteraceae bacterium]